MKRWFLAITTSLLYVLTPTIISASDQPIIFYHLPKNGGTTVTSLLDQQFLPSQICPQTSFLDLKNTEETKQFKFIRGHFFFYQLKSLKAKRITFLREPVERVLSEHRFWMTDKTGHQENVLYHFLPPGDPIETMQNHQCLFLSSYNPTDQSISMKKHLKSAKQNIKKFFFVGISEDIEQALRALYVLMGWRPASIVPRLNATKRNETYPQELINNIRKRNWADIKLYAYAKRLYAKKLSRIQKSLVIKRNGNSASSLINKR